LEIHAVEILLVEDNPSDVKLTLHALKKHNFVNNIYVVHDGEEAVNLLFGLENYAERDTSARPKVVFLDIKLPKLSGLEVLKIIKSDERTKSIPVVILTSSKEEVDIFSGYNLGVNSYIVKPVEFEKFIQAVSEIGLYWLLLNEPPVMNNLK
jgi:CheY-like chemotaxis protein